MKLYRSYAVALAMAISLSIVGPVAAQEPTTAKVSVNGMVCSFCAQSIEKRISALPEAGPLYINLSSKLVAVQPKSGKTIDADRLRHEIREAGYEVVALEMVPKTVAQLRAEYRGKK